MQVVSEEKATGRNVRQRVQDGVAAAFKMPSAVVGKCVQHPAAVAGAGLIVNWHGAASGRVHDAVRRCNEGLVPSMSA